MTEEEKAFLSGFPIKDFGNDGGRVTVRHFHPHFPRITHYPSLFTVITPHLLCIKLNHFQQPGYWLYFSG